MVQLCADPDMAVIAGATLFSFYVALHSYSSNFNNNNFHSTISLPFPRRKARPG